MDHESILKAAGFPGAKVIAPGATASPVRVHNEVTWDRRSRLLCAGASRPLSAVAVAPPIDADALRDDPETAIVEVDPNELANGLNRRARRVTGAVGRGMQHGRKRDQEPELCNEAVG